MTKWFALLTLLTATPFWDALDVKQWSEEQLIDFFGNSPWSQPAESTSGNGVLTFLATAKPVQMAEVEKRRRQMKKVAGVDVIQDPAWDEFLEFLERDTSKYIVLAVAIPAEATREASEMSLMENQSFMKLGKQKIKMSGYFPPSPTDPYTRLIFPRAGADKVKELNFELFLPGTGTPYRQVFYPVKAMNYRGRLEM
jgi:hypothetical protein